MVGFMVTLMKAGLVFALLAITVKVLRRFDGRAGGSRRRRGNAGMGGGLVAGGRSRRRRRPERVLDVVERAPLGRASSVVLVRVRDQHFVLGVTDQQVAMLLEVDLPDDDDDAIDLRADAGQGQRPAAALSLGELVRQAKLYLPGRSRIEPVDVEDALAAATDEADADRPAAAATPREVPS